MPIYRGPGGAGDATQDASSEVLLALLARDAAVAAQLAAEAAQAGAELAESNAETAETNAETAETNAETAATNAATSATAAAASAASIIGDVALAEAARAGAETAETNAEIAQAAAASSASAASTSASNASTSATNASTSASTATTAATNAGNSATAAATSATNAANSATSASTSASTATTQASNASTSATNAASSATSASASATTATTQAGIATTQASNAATSASAASTSATNAATSASNASSSATAASNAQIAAEAARDATLTAYDNFDDRYLGAKSSDPALDNDGNTLVAGSLYFNTSIGGMKVYTGSAWVVAYVSGGSYLVAANNLSDLTNFTTARSNLGLGTAATTNSTAYATAAQGANADTAYGWGNHALANYVNDTELADALDPYLLANAAATQYADIIRGLPSGGTTGQTLVKSSNSDYATTWATVDALPSQTGNSGKYLTTNGTTASWAVVNVTPALDDLTDVTITSPTNGHVLQYNGTAWVNAASSGGGAQAGIFYENDNVIGTSYTISSNKNAMSVGPLTLSSGSVTVTVNSGSTWTVI